MGIYWRKIACYDLQVHLSQTYMQVLDWMHLAVQTFCRFFLEGASETKKFESY
jgi:hypothetical protein